MEVKRLDIYDYKLWFTEPEFALLKRVADERKISIEAVLSMLVVDGLMELIESLE